MMPWIPDHLAIRQLWTIWIPDWSGIQIPTAVINFEIFFFQEGKAHADPIEYF